MGLFELNGAGQGEVNDAEYRRRYDPDYEMDINWDQLESWDDYVVFSGFGRIYYSGKVETDSGEVQKPWQGKWAEGKKKRLTKKDLRFSEE